MRNWTPTVLPLAAMVVSLARCGFSADMQAERILLGERTTEGRFIGATSWRACAAPDTTVHIAAVRCDALLEPGTRRFDRLTDITRELEAGLQRPDSTSQFLRTLALANVQWQYVMPESLDRAVRLLEIAIQRQPLDASLYNDFAVVQLQLAYRDDNLDPLLRALDAVERAYALDPDRAEIRFNRALVLERAYLLSQSMQAWTEFLADSIDSPWTDEAEQHHSRLREVLSAPIWPRGSSENDRIAAMAGTVELTRLVQNYPDAAREYVFTVVLPDWSRAVAASDRARAFTAIDLAGQIVSALDQIGADRSIAHILDHVRRLEPASSTQDRLAAGFLKYANGFDLYARGYYDQAADSLADAAEHLANEASPMARWAVLYQAGALSNSSEYDAADALFRRTIVDADSSESALIGKAMWSLGVTQIRRGNPEAAARRYAEAVPHIEAAKEPESLGALSLLRAEAYNIGGFNVSAREEALHGLERLSPFRQSHFLNNHLTTVAEYARRRGLDRAAMAVMGEVLDVAVTLENPGTMARALRAHAAELLKAGRLDPAGAELDSALRVAEQLPEGTARDRTIADVRLVTAQVLLHEDPDAALATLTDVVNTYNALDVATQYVIASYHAALAARHAGRPADARRHLERAVRHVMRQHSSYESAESRIALFETAENVFDEMVALALAEDNQERALAYLEQSRNADLATSAPAPGSDLTATDVVSNRRLPADVVILDYALLSPAPTLFVIAGAAIHTYEIAITRDSLATLIGHVRTALMNGSSTAQHSRAALYDLLLRPAAEQLEDARSVVIVPDRELHALPFAALWDERQGEYFIEQYEITTVPSIDFFHRSRQRSRVVKGDRVLVAGNPDVGADLDAEFPRLRGADREAREIGALYGAANVRLGATATRPELTTLLATTSVFHFAGHAVFDPDRPEMSYLALTPEGDDAESAWRARDIRRFHWPALHTVVLSACNTLNARPVRTGPTAGVAHAFVAAGASSLISTLWPIDDDRAVDLSIAIHRHLRAGLPPGAALRAAQLAAIESDNSAGRAPGVWTSFVYTGS